jgi:hypothetical protein
MLGDRALYSLLYADDVVLLAETEEQLQRMIDVVDKFCREWRLKINLKKSKVMVVAPSGAAPTQGNWQFQGHAIDLVDRYKYLGIWFTNKLLWDQHIKLVSESSKATLAGLRRTFAQRALPLRVKRTLWTTLVRPKLEHGAQVWNCNTSQAAGLEAIQHRALYWTLRTNMKCSKLALRSILGLPSLQTRRKQLRLLYLGKLLTKADSTWPRHAYNTLPHASSKVVGRSQKHWRQYTEQLIKEAPGGILSTAHTQLLRSATDWDGGTPNPFTQWKTAVTAYATAVDYSAIRVQADSSDTSTIHVVARALQRDIGGAPSKRSCTIGPVDAPPSGANWIRIRLLSGTSALNDMLARITRNNTARSALCPLCGEHKETVRHFLRDCNSTSELRDKYEESISAAGFGSLDPLAQCAFILGCKVDGLTPSKADDAESEQLVSQLWALRSKALTEATRARLQEDSTSDSDMSVEEQGQPKITSFFSSQPTRRTAVAAESVLAVPPSPSSSPPLLIPSSSLSLSPSPSLSPHHVPSSPLSLPPSPSLSPHHHNHICQEHQPQHDLHDVAVDVTTLALRGLEAHGINATPST